MYILMYDEIMKNYPLGNSDSSTNNNSDNIYLRHMRGGASNNEQVLKSRPTGSCPPVYMCTKEDFDKQKQKDKDKARGFAGTKKETAITIQAIMSQRRDEDKK